jgi:ABC-2 type transport system permease protein
MKLLRSEFTKLLYQKRTYFGWAGLFVVPILAVLALYLSRNQAHHDQGPGGFIALALHNGMYVPVAALVLLSAFLLPLLASMAGSFPLAGEAEQGTIKTWLMHPVRRGSVLFSKWGVAVIYMAISLALVAVSAYGAGAVAFGLHAPLLLTGATVSVAQGIWLTFLSYLFVVVGIACVVSLALLFSTFTNSSLTAAVGALVVVIIMDILGNFSYFDFLKPYLFTSHLDAWQSLFSQPISWSPIAKGLFAFGAYIVVLTGAAWYKFRRKDILV